METQFQNVSVEALTVDNVPIMQASRLEDYSPEFWASTANKGAAVLHMLRRLSGDEAFFHERVWRLPRCYYVNDSRRGLPAPTPRSANRFRTAIVTPPAVSVNTPSVSASSA